MRRAAEALEQDATHLTAISRRLAGDPAFLEIVEGGSGGVRPGASSLLLGSALPKESGWGVVLLDRKGSAVAWAGEPGDLRPPPRLAREGSRSRFAVTQGTLAHESPVGRSPETSAWASRRDAPLSDRHRPARRSRGALPGRFPDGASDSIRASTVPGRLVALSWNRRRRTSSNGTSAGPVPGLGRSWGRWRR